MGRQPTVSAARPARAARSAGLEDFYGAAVPATAWLLETYVRDGAIPLRGCGDTPSCAMVVDLQQAARALGADPADTRRHLHRLHAAGRLTIDEHGTVDITTP